MKTHALLAFSFSFFVTLFAFTRAEYIYDSDGDIVNNGGNYYILPPAYGGTAIEGAAVVKGQSGSCSLAVVAVVSYDKGWAAKIATPYPLKYITNDYPLNISFASLPSNTCTNTSSWTVTNIPGFDGDPVMVGKPQEFSVPRSGYFYIKKYDSTQFYKFAFCYSTSSCGYVTLKADATHRSTRLVVTRDRSVQPLVFKLVKASGEDVDSGISMVV
ncbi:trypsin inhibitor-like [Prosopis cineraria]|uniref:trypsin inhibitor-like n=1 Tax=Prosopis cineraria TaxID=364024 RepID=UPI00240F63E8|nr:trypsin inhibitor-like [Prosopis cineraria]